MINSFYWPASYEVLNQFAHVSYKRRDGQKNNRAFQIDYTIQLKSGEIETISDWLWFEAHGRSRTWHEAHCWWMVRSILATPKDVELAVALFNAGAVAGAFLISAERYNNEWRFMTCDELDEKPKDWDGVCLTRNNILNHYPESKHRKKYCIGKTALVSHEDKTNSAIAK